MTMKLLHVGIVSKQGVNVGEQYFEFEPGVAREIPKAAGEHLLKIAPDRFSEVKEEVKAEEPALGASPSKNGDGDGKKVKKIRKA